MRKIRSFLFGLWMILTVLVMGLISLPFIVISSRLVLAAIRTWCALLMWGAKHILGITYEIRGYDHLSDTPVLIAAKHFSMADTVIPFLFLPRAPAFVLKKQLLNIPIYGWHARAAKMIPVDRSAGGDAIRKMRKHAADRIQNHRDILIFPEGTRKTPNDNPDYKSGVYGLYQSLYVPCQPMALNTGLIWPARGLPSGPGHLIFQILPVIPTGLKRGEFMKRLETDIETATNALIEETRATH